MISQRLRLSRGGFPPFLARLFGTVALAAVVLAVVHVSPTSAAVPTYSNGFEENTHDWTNQGGTITRQASGFPNQPNPGGYANAVPSAAGGWHARLDRRIVSCFQETGGGGPTVQCQGPLTKWGGYNLTWPVGGYTTQLDIYLDAEYATANPDSYGGNMSCLLPPGNALLPTCKGTRFDYSSAINHPRGATPARLRVQRQHGAAWGHLLGLHGPRHNECRPDRSESERPRRTMHSHLWLVHVQAHVLRGRWLPQGADADHSGRRRTRDGELDHHGD